MAAVQLQAFASLRFHPTRQERVSGLVAGWIWTPGDAGGIDQIVEEPAGRFLPAGSSRPAAVTVARRSSSSQAIDTCRKHCY